MANLQRLNPEQRSLVDAVECAANEITMDHPPKCRAFVMQGLGDSGKTMVYNTLISSFRAKGIPVVAAAWTGIAVTLLHGGCTVHNWFKLPVIFCVNLLPRRT